MEPVLKGTTLAIKCGLWWQAQYIEVWFGLSARNIWFFKTIMAVVPQERFYCTMFNSFRQLHRLVLVSAGTYNILPIKKITGSLIYNHSLAAPHEPATSAVVSGQQHQLGKGRLSYAVLVSDSFVHFLQCEWSCHASDGVAHKLLLRGCARVW